MSRTNQLTGLTRKALKIARAPIECERRTTITWPDGRVETTEDIVYRPSAKHEQYATYEGLGGEEFPLNKWTHKDGTVYYEAVQADPWNSGPAIYLALKDDDGGWVEESMWPMSEIEGI